VLARREKEAASTAATGTSVAVADRHYPRAEKIHVVLDNLSTHSAASLYTHFPPLQARRIMLEPVRTTVPRYQWQS
jgi:hypothetical protein